MARARGIELLGIGVLAWAAGCAPRGACDALVTCTGFVNPFLVEATQAEYGRGGACWGERDAADCVEACEVELLVTYANSEVPACDPAPFVGESVMTESEFYEAYAAAYCQAVDDCDAPWTCNPTSTNSCGATFSPVAADACLAAGFTCQTFGDYSYVVAAEVCGLVCTYDTYGSYVD